MEKRKSRTTQEHFLDHAVEKHGRRLVNDTKILLRILVLYIPLPVFYALYDQQGSRWILQATRMDGDLGFMTIKPDQIQVFNPIMILSFIPLFEAVIYPLISKIGINTPLRKLTVGGFLAAIAFIVSGIVEMQLEKESPILPDAHNAQFRVFNGYPCDYAVQSDLYNFTLSPLGAFQVKQVPLAQSTDVQLNFLRINSTDDIECPRAFEKHVELEPNVATSLFVAGKDLAAHGDYIDDPDQSNSKIPTLRLLISSATTQKLVIRNQARYDHILLNSNTNNQSLVEGVPATYEILIDDKVIGAVSIKQGSVSTVIVYEQPNGTFIFNKVEIVPPNSLNILWLLPQYVILTMGEVMFNITGLAFSYAQAPESMKSVLQAAWLFTNSLGDALLMIIVGVKVFESRAYEFFLFSALMAVDMVLFMFLAYRYKMAKPVNDDQTK